MSRVHSSHLRDVICSLIPTEAARLPAARAFSRQHFPSASSHVAPALPCLVSTAFGNPYTHSGLWRVELSPNFAENGVCIFVTHSLCYFWMFSSRKRGIHLTAWTTFRPQVPPSHLYTSISSTIKDTQSKVTRPLTRMANKIIIKFFMNELLLLRE